jgi:uncharacterized protein GlcG (DUF336 family)
MESIERREINSSLALQMVGYAIQLAEEKSIEISAVVCDPRGHLVALARTDNVMPPAIEYAIDKAWTSANFSISTLALYERISVKPPVVLGFANRDRVLFFPGGLPVIEDNICIGGLGVSGAKDQEDIDIAQTTIKKFGLAFEKDG